MLPTQIIVTEVVALKKQGNTGVMTCRVEGAADELTITVPADQLKRLIVGKGKKDGHKKINEKAGAKKGARKKGTFGIG
jgi:hypothetical protein